MNDFLQKLKKVVLIVLYGPAISQSDCRKAGWYQLSLILIKFTKAVFQRKSQTGSSKEQNSPEYHHAWGSILSHH